MLPWSVIPSAGCSSAAAASTSSSTREAPSSMENSVCVWRWTKRFRSAMPCSVSPPCGCPPTIHTGSSTIVDESHRCDLVSVHPSARPQADRAAAFSRATMRLRAIAGRRAPGGVTRPSRRRCEAAAMSATAWSKMASLAFDGLVYPLILRTYWRAALRTSSVVAASSPRRVTMLRHMVRTLQIGARWAWLGLRHRSGRQLAPHLLELLAGLHLLREQRRLDAVEQALEPPDELSLCDPQLGLAGRRVTRERRRQAGQLLAQVR